MSKNKIISIFCFYISFCLFQIWKILKFFNEFYVNYACDLKNIWTMSEKNNHVMRDSSLRRRKTAYHYRRRSKALFVEHVSLSVKRLLIIFI